MDRSPNSGKELVISKKDTSLKYWMSKGEYTNIIVNARQTNSEYVITDGIIEPAGFVPEHYHKWEDQTFHVLEGEVEAKIDKEWHALSVGDTVHCPKGTSHFIRNTSGENARLLSYIFPGNFAEDFFAETSRQNLTGERDLALIERLFGVVYL